MGRAYLFLRADQNKTVQKNGQILCPNNNELKIDGQIHEI